MMKLAFAFLALLPLSVAPAYAGMDTINAQYGANAGFNQQTGCLMAPYHQCLNYSNQVLGWSGTVTVKQPGVELLAVVLCGSNTPSSVAQQVWRGEMMQGTLSINSPAHLPPDITGPCWVEYQLDSSSANPPGSAWEIQLTVYFYGNLHPLPAPPPPPPPNPPSPTLKRGDMSFHSQGGDELPKRRLIDDAIEFGALSPTTLIRLPSPSILSDPIPDTPNMLFPDLSASAPPIPPHPPLNPPHLLSSTRTP